MSLKSLVDTDVGNLGSPGWPGTAPVIIQHEGLQRRDEKQRGSEVHDKHSPSLRPGFTRIPLQQDLCTIRWQLQSTGHPYKDISIAIFPFLHEYK